MIETAAILYTAGQIAAVVGLSPRQVRARLPADAAVTVKVNGQKTLAWPITALPESWRLSLVRSFTVRLGGVEIPLERVNMGELHPEIIEGAEMLNEALAPSIARKDDESLSAEELKARGVEDYARVFGHPITPRYWDELFRRTLARDAGNEEFGRLALYLPNQLKRKADALPAFSAATGEEFRELHDVMATFRQPASPTSAEESLLWLRAFELLESLVADGRAEKKLRGRLLKFLWKHAPWLAASPNALRVMFDRKLKRWREQGRCIAALEDKREAKRGEKRAPAYDPDQVGIIRYYAGRYAGGRRPQAARELDKLGLIHDPRIKHALDTATSKSVLPASLRAEMTDVPAIRVCHLGPRAMRKMKPRRELTYDGIFSNTCLCGDDLTVPMICWAGNEEGWVDLFRPQMIGICDFRSTLITARAIAPRPQYTALDVYGAFRATLEKYGKPRWIQREGGLWRRAGLVNALGRIGAPFSPAEVEASLERGGVRFTDDPVPFNEALFSAGIEFRESYSPNTKPIERVFDLLQARMEKEPSYVGREERYDCTEEMRRKIQLVQSKKAHPSDLGIPSFEELVKRIDAIIVGYNSDRQDGRRLAHPITGEGMSPEEAYQYFENRDDPPDPIDERCRVALAWIHDEVIVKAPNIRRRQFPCGFIKFRGHTYCNADTGLRVGQKLLAHFDPLRPETCTFTDHNLRNPFTVPRLEPCNALFTDEHTRQSSAQAGAALAAIKTDFRAMEAKFEPLLRRVIGGQRAAELTEHVKEATQRHQQRQRTADSRARKIQNTARNVGAPAAVLANDEQTDRALARMQRGQRALASEEASNPVTPAESQ